MSAPAVKRTCYDPPVDAELERWPGVTWLREVRGKHYALILTYGDVSRFVIYPTSPGDTIRGPKNHLANVRQALRQLGAVREEAEGKAPAERRRKARPGTRPVNLSPTEPQRGASPTRDPWAALSAINIPPPPVEPTPSLSVWSRFLAFLRAVLSRVS